VEGSPGARSPARSRCGARGGGRGRHRDRREQLLGPEHTASRRARLRAGGDTRRPLAGEAALALGRADRLGRDAAGLPLCRLPRHFGGSAARRGVVHGRCRRPPPVVAGDRRRVPGRIVALRGPLVSGTAGTGARRARAGRGAPGRRAALRRRGAQPPRPDGRILREAAAGGAGAERRPGDPAATAAQRAAFASWMAHGGLLPAGARGRWRFLRSPRATRRPTRLSHRRRHGQGHPSRARYGHYPQHPARRSTAARLPRRGARAG
jgi:hypothetical protein